MLAGRNRQFGLCCSQASLEKDGVIGTPYDGSWKEGRGHSDRLCGEVEGRHFLGSGRFPRGSGARIAEPALRRGVPNADEKPRPRQAPSHSIPPTTRLQGHRSKHPYKTIQHPDPSPFSKVNSAARVAASKTSSTPSPLRLEHSRYLRAEISRATDSPSWPETKRSDFLRCSSTATGSSRRSFFRPTRMMGTFGQRRVASVIHCLCRQLAFVFTFATLCCWAAPAGLALCYRSGSRGRGWRVRAGGERTLCFTLSNESGASTAKPINMTCAFEYASGRSLS